MNILICIQLHKYTDLYSTTWIYWSVFNYVNILICIQLREYTDLYSTTWIYWSVYTRLTQHTPNARSCSCNQLYLDYNSRPSKLVCVLVWLWLLLSSESCSLLIQLFWATIQSVFTHDEKHVQLRNTEYVERWDCYLCIAYIFFTWLNMRVIILVNKLYCSFMSRPPGWETLT